MNNKVILGKCLNLAYLSGIIPDIDINMISETVNSVLVKLKLPEATFTANPQREMWLSIADLVKDVMSNAYSTPYDRDKVKNDLKLICGAADADLYDAILKTLVKEDLDIDKKRRVLLMELNNITRMDREEEVAKLISGANIDLSLNKEKIPSVAKYVDELILKLENIGLSVEEQDSAVSDDFTFDDGSDAVEEVFQKALDLEDGRTIWKLNWKEMSTAFMGGFRPAETVLIGAMQHSYKSYLTLTLFKGLPMYNDSKNFIRDPSKKPLISRISFEDPMVKNLSWLALNILWNQHIADGGDETNPPSISNMSKEDLADTVMRTLKTNGWHIHMAKVDGSEWSYKDIQKKALQLEAAGYELHAQIIDYLFICGTKGLAYDTTGSDVRALLRKMAGFYSSKEVLFITPVQLSPAVKRLISEGRVEKPDLLPYIKGLGMTSGSSKLSEVSDIMMYTNVFKPEGSKNSYVHVLVEKHRNVKVLANEALKSFYIKLPENGLSALDDPDGKLGICTYKLPRAQSSYF